MYNRGYYGGSYGMRGYGSYGGYGGYSGYGGYGGRDAMYRMSTRPWNNFNGGYMRDYNYMRPYPYGGYGYGGFGRRPYGYGYDMYY